MLRQCAPVASQIGWKQTQHSLSAIRQSKCCIISFFILIWSMSNVPMREIASIMGSRTGRHIVLCSWHQHGNVNDSPKQIKVNVEKRTGEKDQFASFRIHYAVALCHGHYLSQFLMRMPSVVWHSLTHSTLHMLASFIKPSKYEYMKSNTHRANWIVGVCRPLAWEIWTSLVSPESLGSNIIVQYRGLDTIFILGMRRRNRSRLNGIFDNSACDVHHEPWDSCCNSNGIKMSNCLSTWNECPTKQFTIYSEMHITCTDSVSVSAST